MSSTSARLAIRRMLKAWRVAADLSQEELASRIEGWDQKHVSRVEMGELSIRLEEAPAVCRALGVPLRRLLLELDREDRIAVGLPAHEDDAL